MQNETTKNAQIPHSKGHPVPSLPERQAAQRAGRKIPVRRCGRQPPATPPYSLRRAVPRHVRKDAAVRRRPAASAQVLRAAALRRAKRPRSLSVLPRFRVARRQGARAERELVRGAQRAEVCAAAAEKAAHCARA